MSSQFYKKRQATSLIFWVSLLFLTNCASYKAGRKTRQDFRQKVVLGQYEKAQKVLAEEAFYKEEKSRLLYLLEKAMLFHYQGQYQNSVGVFEKALVLVDKLYTVRISKKILTAVANDNEDIYYGSVYERSLIYFYLGLGYYLLHQEDPQKGYLMKARSHMVGWDSFLETMKKTLVGDYVYKSDLAQKVLAGTIHESFGTLREQSIALDLYKNAHLVLKRNYNAYKSFNLNFKEFRSDFKKLPSLSEDLLHKKYIRPSQAQKDLKIFLDKKILRLTKKINPRGLKKTIKRYKISSKLASKIKKAPDPNLTLIAQLDLIPAKKAKKYQIGLNSAFTKASDSKQKSVINAFGVTLLTAFAANTLGLIPQGNNWNLPGAYLGLQVARLAVEEAAISYELPIVQNWAGPEKVEVKFTETKSGKVIKAPLILTSPLGDISELTLASYALKTYFKTGTRLATKHLVAVAQAYGTYQLIKKNTESPFLAKNAAVLSYVAASKLIESSEAADTRYWSLLPKEIRFAEVKIDPGLYKIELISYSKADAKEPFKTHLLASQKQIEKGTRLLNFSALLSKKTLKK